MPFCVFIPGIQGSKLLEGSNTRFPAYRREAMEYLELKQGNSPMETSELFTVLKFDVYTTIDTYLKTKFGENNFKHFTYDWRFELSEHFESLYSLLYGKSDIVIIAHSMGGLLIKLFLHWCYDEEKELDISKIYTLGTPWQGSVESIYMLKYGNGFPKWFFKKIPSFIGWANSETMKKVSNSFPSLFHLLPHENYIDNISPILFNPDMTSLSSRETYLKLLDSKQYSNYLNYSQVIQHIISAPWPSQIDKIHTAIIGHNLCTLGSIVLDQNVSGGKVNKKKLRWTSGDKTVPIASGEPIFNCRKLYIKKDHLGLAQDFDILDFIASDCGVSENTTWKHQTKPSLSYSGRELRIACPVSVAISNNGKLLAGEIDSFESAEEMFNIYEPEQTNTYRIEDSFFIFIDDEDYQTGACNNNSDSTDNELELEITSYDDGLATIEIDKYEDGTLFESKIFNGLELTKETSARLIFEDYEDIKTAQLIQADGQTGEEINGFTLTPEEIEKINHPITNWVITNQPNGENEKLKFYNSVNLNVKIDNVSNVTNMDILEYRYILNGKLFQSSKPSFNIRAIGGKNTLTVFTVAKNGLTDTKPKTIQFEIGTIESKTHRQIILKDNELSILFNTNSNAKDELFKVTFLQEQEGKFEIRPAIHMPYPTISEKINFYTVDKFKNKGNLESFYLPDLSSKEVIFNHANTVKEIAEALNIDNIEKWDIKVNGRKTKNPESKITSKTRKVELLLNETMYIIVFEEEFELFWEKGSELISSGDKELDFMFVIKSASSRVTIHIDDLDSIKVKAFSKDNIELPLEMNVEFINEKELFKTTLIVSQLPDYIDKGYLKVFINDRPAREIKFVFE